MFLGDTLEGGHSLLAVVALVPHRRHVLPAEAAHDVDHGLRLVRVGRHDAREVHEPLLVAQLDARRRVADLRDLRWTEQKVITDLIIAGRRQLLVGYVRGDTDWTGPVKLGGGEKRSFTAVDIWLLARSVHSSPELVCLNVDNCPD